MACVSVAVLGLMSKLAVGATTQVTLAGLTVDGSGYVGTVTDPGSGAVFSHGYDNGSPTGSYFVIDYWNSTAGLAAITPGRVLSTEGYVGNGGVSLAEGFGFTMTLPQPASEVDMTLAYIANAGSSLTLNAYNISDGLLASTVFTPTTDNQFLDSPFDVATASNSINSITVTPTTNIGDAFGNISSKTSSVPEPAITSMAATGLIALARRRARSPKAISQSGT